MRRPSGVVAGPSWVDTGGIPDPDDLGGTGWVTSAVRTANVDGSADQLEDADSGGTRIALRSGAATSVDGRVYRFRVEVAKDAVVSRFPAFRVVVSGDLDCMLHFNTATGAWATESAPGAKDAFDSVTVTDLGDGYWRLELVLPAATGGGNAISPEINPARATTIGTGSGAAVGSIVVRQGYLEYQA